MAKRMKVPQQRAIETRLRIVEAAYRVFSRRGYGQATVDEIGDEAGVSMGALYHHFSSKEELFRAILDQHMREEELEFVGLLPGGSFHFPEIPGLAAVIQDDLLIELPEVPH